MFTAPAPARCTLPDNTTEEIRSRRIQAEEMVRLQLQRITDLRSNVDNPNRVIAWSEALEALVDLTKPWHSPAFEAAWQDRPVACIEMDVDGITTHLPCPTIQDVRHAQQLVIDMLDDADLLVKRRKSSGPIKEEKPI